MQIWMILGLVFLCAFVAYACMVVAGRSDEQAERMFEEWQREHQQNKTVDEPQHEDAPKDKNAPENTDLPEDKNLPGSR